jgi:site-specific DNA-cytosine methylase
MEKITHYSTFSGIGGATSALIQAGIPHKTIGISEIDKGAIRFRKEILGSNPPNLGNIDGASWSHIESPYLFTGGFPCQSFSVMGKMTGFLDPNDPKIRATMAMRDMINDLQPNYVLMENVKGIYTKTQRPFLKSWLDTFTNYNVHIHILNPHTLGYIQSRTRVFFALTRKDMAPWIIPDTLPQQHTPRQTWADIVDPIPDPTSFYTVGNKSRIKIVMKPTDTKFNCVTRGGVQSHCGRMSWIPHKGSYRSPSTTEHFRIFAYQNIPSIKTTRLINRKVQSTGFGNSWHIGHASLVLSYLPLPKGIKIS